MLGLVSQVCPPEELDRQPQDTAIMLDRVPTVAYGRVKDLFRLTWAAQLEDQLDAESQEISKIALTRDIQEGIRAFTDTLQP